jgi:hypothetical protein
MLENPSEENLHVKKPLNIKPFLIKQNPVVSPTENLCYVIKPFSQKPSASGMVAAWFFWHALPSERPANKLQLSFLLGMQLSTAVTIQQTRRI